MRSQFDPTALIIDENAGTVTVTVTRLSGINGAVSVDYTTSDGTAIDGSDYTSAFGTLNWANFDLNSKTFIISIIDDTLYESDETINLSLSNAVGASAGTPKSHTITIIDNDGFVDPCLLLGDFNCDGVVDQTDVILALQVMAGIEPSTTVHKEADVNGDAKIGIEEVIYILQKVSGLR